MSLWWWDWWTRKDVSLRFKFLNMLSGDRLRPQIAFLSSYARNVTKAFEHADILEDPVIREMSYEQARFYAKKVRSEIEDTWLI